MTVNVLELQTETSQTDAPIEIDLSPADSTAFSQWAALEQQLDRVPLAASSAWTETWLRHYGDLVTARVAVARSAGRVCGMCLMTDARSQRAGPFRLRTRHLGTAGEPQADSVCVEYNSVLAAPEQQVQVTQAVWQSLQQDAGWDELRLDGFDEQTCIAEIGDASIQWERRVSRYFDLDAAREGESGILERLGGNTRSQLRRTLKKYGSLDVQWATSLNDADDILGELVELHQARWQAVGQPGAFASRRFLDFQRDLLARLVPDERVVLVRVRHDGETVGCLMLLNDRGRLLDYLSGFADFQRKPSPGIVSHYLCMEEALRRGFSAYDFLVGDKRHKENLSTHTNQLVWGVLRRPSFRNRTIQALRRVRQFT
jgi:CelD/BcsL family acetyltransferase involved in cellulose biosynthesis